MKSIGFLSILGLIVLAFMFPFEKRAPIGAPTNFYEIAEEIEHSDVSIIYFGNNEPFPEEVSYITYKSVNDIPLIHNKRAGFIVFDIDPNTQLSDTDVDRLKKLYESFEYNIIIMNNTSIGLNDLIEAEDRNQDLVLIRFDEQNDYYFSTSVSFEYDNLVTKQYILMHQIEKIINK